MRRMVFALMAVATLAGCTNTEKGAALGGVAGGVAGGLLTGDAGGVVVGAAVGAIGGALIGRATEPGYCRYRRNNGTTYVARC